MPFHIRNKFKYSKIKKGTKIIISIQTSRYISLLLTSKNSARVCCHENSALSRCHGVDPIPAEEKMPLSCPDDGKWIKTSKQQCL